MNVELDKMAALVNELIDRNEDLERRLASATAQVKSASVKQEPVEVVKQASAECVNDTCSALVAANLITADQVEQTKQAFAKDPEAVHRTVQAILDAQAQVKTAAAEQDLSGGRLVGSSDRRTDAYDNSMSKMQKILGISF